MHNDLVAIIVLGVRYLLPEHVGPCTLRITYSGHTDLSVKFQSHRSRYPRCSYRFVLECLCAKFCYIFFKLFSINGIAYSLASFLQICFSLIPCHFALFIKICFNAIGITSVSGTTLILIFRLPHQRLMVVVRYGNEYTIMMIFLVSVEILTLGFS